MKLIKLGTHNIFCCKIRVYTIFEVFMEFIRNTLSNPPLMITVLLTLGVILVNGWTDAPNAIATVISTRSMEPKRAIAMAAVMNFLGVLVMTMINKSVAETISKMVNFGNSNEGLVALCAALFAIVLWATAAWYFGIPTSESHALIAGLSGSAIAFHGGLSGINPNEWVKVLQGLGLSTFLGFFSGYIVVKVIETIFKNIKRSQANDTFGNLQVVSAGAMAFMHGAQDGQKFMGVFLLGIYMAQGQTIPAQFSIPLWLMVLVSAVMAFGTSVGGYRIIKAVGMDMVRLQKYQGFAADTAASLCLLLASITGIPVSTTHTKTTAIMGVGAAKRVSSVNWKIVGEMVLAWVLTFPGCGLIGYLVAKLFMMLF